MLDVEGVEVTYSGAVRALRGVDLHVGSGEVVAVLGGNGAGKTTLLRAISGTLRRQRGRIEAGRILLDGDNLAGEDAADIVGRGVGHVPEGRRVFERLTVEENLRAGAATVSSRATRAEARTRVFDLFPILAERRGLRAVLLSGGEQQMLAIGRALMSNPRLLLLDEPSLGLAPQVISRIGEVLTEINRQGASIVLVEQNASMALRVARTANVLELGRVSLSGPAAELATSEEVVRLYLAQDAAGTAGAAHASATPGKGGTGPATARPMPTRWTRRVRGLAARTPATGPPADAPTLEVDSVTVRFGALTALSDVSFRVAPGSIHAVIGPNGAGKSTLFNVVSGIYRASHGQVRFGGTVLTGLRPHTITGLGVGRALQNTAAGGHESVADTIMVGRHPLMRTGLVAAGLRLPPARREERSHRARVAEIARLVGLGHLLDAPVGALPYGHRKRVELARALASEPRLLLLDEPVAGMAASEKQEMSRIIAGLRSRLGTTVLLVEHDMSMVMSIADRVSVLDFGRLIADGPPDLVRTDPAVAAAYLGTGSP